MTVHTKPGIVGKGTEVHVYLLHFEQPVGKAQSAAEREANGLAPRAGAYRAHARHYVGATHDLGERLHDHATGNGARLLRAVAQAGIDFALVKVWYGGGWTWEQQLKRQHNHKRYCPICRQEADFEPYEEERLDEILPAVADPFWPW